MLRRRLEELFPILERAPRLFPQRVGVTPETLTEAQKRLMEKFRTGIAEALGVPPEAIKEEPLERWIIEWSKAWVKEEYWASAIPSDYEVYRLGKELGTILKDSLK